LKINVDGAFMEKECKAGIGIVCRDTYGKLLDGLDTTRDASSALMSEALAMRLSCNVIRNRGRNKIIIETDCKVLLDAIQKRIEILDWRCSSILYDISQLSADIQSITFPCIACSGNKAADWVTKMAIKRMCPIGWVGIPPSSLANILVNDAMLAQHNCKGIG